MENLSLTELYKFGFFELISSSPNPFNKRENQCLFRLANSIIARKNSHLWLSVDRNIVYYPMKFDNLVSPGEQQCFISFYSRKVYLNCRPRRHLNNKPNQIRPENLKSQILHFSLQYFSFQVVIRSW